MKVTVCLPLWELGVGGGGGGGREIDKEKERRSGHTSVS